MENTTKYLSLVTTVTIFVAFSSILLQAYLTSNNLKRVTTTFSSLIYLENTSDKRDINTLKNVAVGYGSCSDLYVRAVDFLNFTDNIQILKEFNVDEITTENDFLQSFIYYFQRGAASERFTPNSELFNKLIRLAKKNPNADPRWNIGGNAPVMGTRFLLEGARVLLGAKMSRKLRPLLNANIELAGEEVAQDDIHFILEYKTGDKFGDYVAPRANRYILHNDQNNPMINSFEEFNASLKTFNPRLLVVSGLQMLDNYPFKSKDIREERLLKVREQMSNQSPSTLIHFEMASFVEIELIKFLAENIVPFSDSIGMNEQELDNLEQVLKTGTISLSADSNPRVAASLNQMRSVFKIVNNKYHSNTVADAKRRMLTRIHVHTLAYQAIMIVRDKEWKNTKNAAAKASLRAFRHVCGTETVNPESAYLVLDDSFSTTTSRDDSQRRIHISKTDPVSCWNETLQINSEFSSEVEICVAPVLVCRVAQQTAGAGDNISAAGLYLQI